MATFRARELSATEAAQQLGMKRSRFYQLYGDYLKSCAQQRQTSWTPGVSGGDHAPEWPLLARDLIRRRLSSHPPSPYSFIASEVKRLCAHSLTRAQVRRWAIENGLQHSKARVVAKAPVRRWQRSKIGELWQLDASPHRWFPSSDNLSAMLNMLDDCSRVFVGSTIYHRENLLAYLEFLPAAFIEYGLPLVLYVDFHSFFFTQRPEALTQLGWALRFYGVTFKYAPTPQAKGKVERAHQYWQNRLPAYFASENITDLGSANDHIKDLRLHRNQHETHRELQQTPQAAWLKAHQDKRSVIRTAPRCPWWPYVWSQQTIVRVSADGRVPAGSHWVSVQLPPKTKVISCLHTSGHHSILAHPPHANHKPVILFTDRPL